MTPFAGLCGTCGGRVFNLMNAYTHNVCVVDAAPRKDGYVSVDLENGYWQIPPQVVIKKRLKAGEELYYPHFIVCQANAAGIA